MKIVINRCFGGFSLSKKATEMYAEKKGLKPGKWNDSWDLYEGGDFLDEDISRNDPVLIEVVETLGNGASGRHSELKIVDIPDDVNWVIKEYDGFEHVAEVHRTWR